MLTAEELISSHLVAMITSTGSNNHTTPLKGTTGLPFVLIGRKARMFITWIDFVDLSGRRPADTCLLAHIGSGRLPPGYYYQRSESVSQA